MGIIEHFYNASSSNTLKRLANPNRPFYRESLFLFIVCRSLPEPDPSQLVQIDSLKKVFRSVTTAIHGTLSWTINLDVTLRQFDTANDLLENYIRVYHVGAQFGSYMESTGPLLTFTQSTRQEDNWAKKTLEEFSKTVDQKVDSDSVKGRNKRMMIDVTVWGPRLVHWHDHSDVLTPMAVSFLIPHIKIEAAARIDTLLYRVFKFCAARDAIGFGGLLQVVLWKLRSLELDRNPQFYDISPDDTRQFNDMEKIVPIPPWTPVSNILGKMLHIVPTPNSILGPKPELDTFYQEWMQNRYTNAWPFIAPGRRDKRLDNLIAVLRNGTPLRSLSLPSPSEHQRPCSHSIEASSSNPGVDSSTNSDLELLFKETFSHSLEPEPDPVVEPDVASSEMPEQDIIPFDDRPREQEISKRNPSLSDQKHEGDNNQNNEIDSLASESFYWTCNNSTATFRVSNHSTSSICSSASQATVYSYASSRTGDVDYGLYYTRRAYSLETLAESLESL